MYGFKKLLLINRKLRLTRKIGRLAIKYEKLSSMPYSRLKREILEQKMDNFDDEIDAIDEVLEYLQKEKPDKKTKISNNSFNVGAKNNSGLSVLPPLNN